MAATYVPIMIMLIAVWIGSTVQVDGFYSDGVLLRKRICNEEILMSLENLNTDPEVFTSIIVDSTPSAPNFKSYITRDIFYGRVSCSNGLDVDGCHYCLSIARTQLFEQCSRISVRALIELNDCMLRYETYNF